MTDSPSSQSHDSRSKVKRLLAEYEFEEVGDRLVEYWLADGEEQRSLRDLAVYFNQRLLRAAMERAEIDVLEGEAENIYRILTDEDVSSGMRVEARHRLESNGIDVDQLEREFVSRQAIHTYLTDYRDVSYPDGESAEDPIERRANTIQRLKNRLSAVCDESLRSLRKAGEISLGDTQVIVSVRVVCTDCERQYEVAELLSNKGCACSESAS